MSNASVLRRVARRETHSSRGFATIVLSFLTIVVAGYLIAEIVMQILGRKPLLLAPSDLLQGISSPDKMPAYVFYAAVVVMVLLGLIALHFALRPGRRSRHYNLTDNLLLIIDDGVLATNAKELISRETGVQAEQVTVSVGKRDILASLKPFSGVSVDVDRARHVLDEQLETLDLTPALKIRVKKSEKGVL